MADSKERPAAPLVTRKELAGWLGTHQQTVTKWEQAGMPVRLRGGRGKPSRYSLADVTTWRIETARGAGDNGELNLQQERAALARAQRLRVEAENRVRSGELVEAAEASQHLVDAGVTTRAKLRGLPSALADRLVGAARDGGQAAVYRLLRAGIDDALWELSIAAGLPDTRQKETRR